jgi:hypothetical protein
VQTLYAHSVSHLLPSRGGVGVLGGSDEGGLVVHASWLD